jgi:steroid delta-isomerase-like uncharacterized protein
MTIKNLSAVCTTLLVVSLALWGCSRQRTGAGLENEIKDLYAALSAHDVDKILTYHTDDLEEIGSDGKAVRRGLEEHRTYLKNLFTSVPDFKAELISVFVSGKYGCEEWFMSGTPASTLENGFPATGKSYSIRVATVREFRDGKTSRIAHYYDSAAVLHQLGALPATSSANPNIGTWKMNPEKSKFSSNPPKSYTMRIQDLGGVDRLIQDTVEADGKTIQRNWFAKADGKDYPVTAPDWDTISYKYPDPNTTGYIIKKGGKELFRGKAVLSKDGKTMVDAGGGKDANGQAFTYSLYLEKQ